MNLYKRIKEKFGSYPSNGEENRKNNIQEDENLRPQGSYIRNRNKKGKHNQITEGNDFLKGNK